jgi:hypothetical protein
MKHLSIDRQRHQVSSHPCQDISKLSLLSFIIISILIIMAYCVVSGSLYGQQGPNVGQLYNLQHPPHFPFPSNFPAIEREKQHTIEHQQQKHLADHALQTPAIEEKG